MAATAKIGTGTTVDHGAFTAKILSVAINGYTIATMDASHMDTSTAKDFIASDLYDAGEVVLELEFIGGLPTLGAFETMTITFPGAAARTVSAAAVGFDAVAALEEKMTATITFKLSGEWSGV